MGNFCIYCGAELKPDAKFCIRCGKAVYQEAGEAPAAQPVQQPVEQPVQETVKQTAQEPVQPVQQPVQQPAQQPVQQTVQQQPVQQPVQRPVQQQPVQQFVPQGAPVGASYAAPQAQVKRTQDKSINNSLLIAGILLGVLILIVAGYFIIKSVIPPSNTASDHAKSAAMQPTATYPDNIAWDELPVTPDDIPDLAAEFLSPKGTPLVSYENVEYGVAAHCEYLIIYDCRFQSTDSCALDFSNISATLNFRRIGSDEPWQRDFATFSGSGHYQYPEEGYTIADKDGNEITVWPVYSGGLVSPDENGNLHFAMFSIWDDHFDDPYFTLDMTYYPTGSDGGYVTGNDEIHTAGAGYVIYLDENFIPVSCDTPYTNYGY